MDHKISRVTDLMGDVFHNILPQLYTEETIHKRKDFVHQESILQKMGTLYNGFSHKNALSSVSANSGANEKVSTC